MKEQVIASSLTTIDNGSLCTIQVSPAAQPQTSGNWSVHDFERLTDELILPLEMAVGLILQIVNLCVLHGHRIKGLAYTIYLKALSITYLISLPFMVPRIVRKLNLEDSTSFWAAFYHAHLEQYFINLFLFSGNLIIVALATEPLRAILFPMASLASTSKGSFCILCTIYVSVAAILLPISFSFGVEPLCSQNRTFGQPDRFASVPLAIPWVDTVRYILTTVFEISIIVLVFFIYTFLLIKFKLIVKHHKRSVNQRTQSSATTLTSNQEKATVMCLASVTAFLVCNALSAARELLYIIFYFQDEPTLKNFRETPAKVILTCVGNILLVFNLTLNFILQCSFSFQYRKQLRRMFCTERAMVTATGRFQSFENMSRESSRSFTQLTQLRSFRRPERERRY